MHRSQHNYSKKKSKCSTCTSMYECEPQIIIPRNSQGLCPFPKTTNNSGIISINPSEGPSIGNNTILITGYNLIFTTNVSMGTTNIPFTIVSNTLLQITAIPKILNTVVNITVYFQNGFSESLPYTYDNHSENIPSITSLQPSSGPIYGSNIIGINGLSLGSTKEIYFNNIITYNFVVNSDSTIHVAVPNLIGQNNIMVYVTTLHGISNSLPYTIIPAPII